MAFANNQLASIALPKNIKSIGESAFAENPITNITIGANIESHIVENINIRGFSAAYNANGRKAGTYNFNEGNWGFQPK